MRKDGLGTLTLTGHSEVREVVETASKIESV